MFRPSLVRVKSSLRICLISGDAIGAALAARIHAAIVARRAKDRL